MHIKINKITPIYEDKNSEPIGAEVSYNLILIDNPLILIGQLESDSKLQGIIVIYNSNPDIGETVMNWHLWDFNKYIFQKIMKSL